MKHLGLFEGIGGFSLASRWMGWKTVAWCEWNEFGQKVLRHHFPEAEGFGDITKTDFRKYANTIDILTGGFPCQPYSVAGKRKGKEDERHLWPEMLRAIREIEPTYVVGENVGGLVSWNGGLVFDEVQSDLEAEGYKVQPFILPACAKNAPHRRDRVWFIAYSESKGGSRLPIRTESTHPIDGIISGNGITTDAENRAFKNTDSNGRNGNEWEKESGIGQQRNISSGNNERLQTNHEKTGITTDTNSGRQPIKEYREAQPGRTAKESISDDWQNFPTQSPICSGDDGISDRLDGITFPKWRNESIKAYGNAIVPQVAFEIFKAIEKLEQ